MIWFIMAICHVQKPFKYNCILTRNGCPCSNDIPYIRYRVQIAHNKYESFTNLELRILDMERDSSLHGKLPVGV